MLTFVWRDARVDYSARLESDALRKGYEGSNPSPSAMYHLWNLCYAVSMTAYFLAVFLSSIIWLGLFASRRDLRRKMWVTGLLLTPFVILDILTVPSYWEPVTLFNIPVGLEGFLFTFFTTGIASVLYQIIFKKRYEYHKIQLNLCIIFIVPAATSYLLVNFLNLNIIYFFILSFFLSGITEVLKRPDLYVNTIMSSLLFCFVYVTVFSLWLFLRPESINWWNTITLSRVKIGQVPLEEALFSLGLGFFVGPLFEYITNAKLVTVVEMPNK